MAAKASGSKGAEFRAGVVVLIGLAILALGLFLVSGGADQFRDKARYTIHFTNSGGVVSGNAVYLAGEKVGGVISVDTVEVPEEGGTRRYKAVVIEVLKTARIQVDSAFSVSKTVTGIVAVNGEYGTGRDADEKTILKGQRLSSFEEAIDHASQLLRDAKDVVAQVKEIVSKVDERVTAIDTAALQQKAEAFLDSLGRSGGKVETILDDSREPIARTLERVEKAAAHAESLLGDVRGGWGRMDPKIQEALDDLKAALAEARAIVEENRPSIKAAVESLRDGLDRVAPALATVERLARDAQVVVIEVRPQLVAALKAARTALENFEAVTEDLKTAPWKLVNKPADKEAREVHLYNAARLHVTNAARIREIVDELDALRKAGALSDEGQTDAINAAVVKLEESLARYAESEKALVALIVAGSAAK